MYSPEVKSIIIPANPYLRKFNCYCVYLPSGASAMVEQLPVIGEKISLTGIWKERSRIIF